MMNDESNEGGVLVTEKDLSEETPETVSPDASGPTEAVEETSNDEEAPKSFGPG